jgi:hypothetical protein
LAGELANTDSRYVFAGPDLAGDAIRVRLFLLNEARLVAQRTLVWQMATDPAFSHWRAHNALDLVSLYSELGAWRV